MKQGSRVTLSTLWTTSVLTKDVCRNITSGALESVLELPFLIRPFGRVGRLVEINFDLVLFLRRTLHSLNIFLEVSTLGVGDKVDVVFGKSAIWANSHSTNVVGSEITSTLRTDSPPHLLCVRDDEN